MLQRAGQITLNQMPKIIKFTFIYVLAFFIFGSFLAIELKAQEVRTLDNGLKVIVEEDHRNPIVVFSAFIDVGSAYEGEYLGSGISHLIEHILFKGTQKYPPGAIEDILHKYGGNIDGFTSYDYTGFRITILKEHAHIGLDILKEMLSNPAFDAEEIKKEKQVIEREMDLSKDNPGRKISRLTFSNAYTRHPYLIPIIGYKEKFKKLERKDLVAFFENNYVPEKIVIAVVGDIDANSMFKDIKNAFGELGRGGAISSATVTEPPQSGSRFIEEKIDGIEGAYLNISFHSSELLNKDLYALDLLSFILGQGESSILNEELRIKDELVLSISAYNYTPKDPGLFIVSSVLREENVAAAIEKILHHIELVKENGMTDKDLSKAKNNFIAGYTYSKETIESKANDRAIGQLLAGNPEFFELYIERIKSVALDEVQYVASKYLNRDNMTVTVISRTGKSLSPVSRASLDKKQERSVKKITLGNKLSVLISENHSLPIASISLLFKGGVRFEDEKNNGISQLTSLMLLDGSKDMSREEIAELYESKGMTVDTYSGNNSLGLTVNCLSEHLEDGLKLLSDLCLNPVFSENELKREKKEILSAIEMQDNKIFNHGHRLLKDLLFTKHPYGLLAIGTRESIDGLERKDAVAFHANMLSPENMALGVAGDCDTDMVEALAEKYFSNIGSREMASPVPIEEPAIEKRREKNVGVKKEQSLLMLGFHGIDIYDKNRYTVDVLIDIFSSESGILFEKIRGESGLSYAQGAFQVLGIDPGYIAIYVLTSKENLGKVEDIIFKEIRSFIKKGVTDEELLMSKNHLKAMRQISMQTNLSFIFTITMDELYGLGYNNYEDYYKNIDAVTKEDIKRVAKDMLALENCTMVALEGVR